MARVFDKMGWTEQVEVASVAARWREVVGDEVADHSEVLSFDAGTLTIRGNSTAWADQLRILSGTVRQRLNEELGRPIVKAVRVEAPAGRSWIKGQRTVKGRGPRDTYG